MMVCMRTTVTLDDDLAAEIKRIALERKTSFTRVLNEVLLRGLSAPESGTQHPQSFRVQAFSSPLRPGIDPEKLNQFL